MRKKTQAYTEKQIRYFLEELHLKKKISVTKIQKIYGISRTTLNKGSKKYKIPIINNSKAIFNYDYFEKIDSEEKAYWLGFIAANGNVREGKKSVNLFQLSLKLSDSSHLEIFKDAINFKKPILKDHFRCRLMLADVVFCKNLIDKGVVPRKSLILKFPTEEQVPTELIRHFIRGYFDGNGCISNPLERAISVSLLGTNDFLKKCLETIGHEDRKLIKDKRNTNVQMFILNGKNAINFLNLMYKDSNVFLQRKYYRYLIYIARYERNLRFEQGKIGEVLLNKLDNAERDVLEFLQKSISCRA